MTCTDDTLTALHRAILENPEDDNARLVYADRLEELGESERAEFIRVQVELTNVVKVCPCYQCAKARGSSCGEPWACTCSALRRREQKLWGSYSDRNDIRSHFHSLMPDIGLGGWVILPESLSDIHGIDRPEAIVSRGFVSEVHLPLAAFLDCAEALFRAHPITRVVLPDWEPVTYGNVSYFFPLVRANTLAGGRPFALADSSQSFVDWYSDYCVQYGRHLAGLTGGSD